MTLRPTTLGGRLIALYTLLIGALAATLVIAIPLLLERQGERDLAAGAESVATVTAGSVAASMRFDSPSTALENLERALLGVRALALRADCSTCSTDGWPIVVTSDAEAIAADQDALRTYEAPVRIDEEEIGTVTVTVSTADLQARVDQARVLMGIIAVTVLGIGVALVVLVSRRITRPLREAVAATARVAEGDLGRRLDDSHDIAEIRALAVGFNAMSERLAHSRRALERSKREVEQILESTPAAVALFDPELRCLHANPVAIPDPERRRAGFGRTPDQTWAEGASGREGLRVLAAMRRALRHNTTVGLDARLALDVELRDYLVRFNPIRNRAGEPTHLVGYAVDVTDQVRAEAELRDRDEQLRQAQKMESIGRLAGGVAHDFNNLLTAISGYAEFARLDVADGNSPLDSIRHIEENAGRAASLTRQLLAFSRRQVLAPRRLDLGEVLDGLAPMLQRLLGEDIDFDLHRHPSLPPVLADAGQIEQVVMNLSVNARDAMPRGGRLQIRVGPVSRRDGFRGVELRVQDNGCGMDDETRERIFEPFFTTKKVGEGTGLGLATVYGIVQQLDGTLEVETEVDVGTTFVIRFPVASEVREPAYGTEVGAAASVSLNDAAGTILLVEDEPGVRRIAAGFLRRAGYEVHEAPSAEEGLRVFQEVGPEQVDLVLTDVVMPGGSGRELADELVRIRPDISIVFMTGYTDDAVVRAGLTRGDITLLDKPFSRNSLLATVGQALAPADPSSAFA